MKIIAFALCIIIYALLMIISALGQTRPSLSLTGHAATRVINPADCAVARWDSLGLHGTPGVQSTIDTTWMMLYTIHQYNGTVSVDKIIQTITIHYQ